MDPIHQFEIINHFPIAKIGNVEFFFTNSAAFMLIAVGLIALLMIGATSSRAMVPGRFQAVAEWRTNLSPDPCKAVPDQRE